jgi:predicted DCC family thiol-disulfide oxidoreductase YuxK
MDRPLLVFDGDCAFCTRSVRFVERRIRRHPDIRSWQSLDLEQLGLSQAACEEAVQWVGADGERASGHVAVARTLVYGGKGWALLGRIIVLPGVRAVAGFVYRWIATNRHRMPGGTAQCSLPTSERTQ